MIYVYVLKLKKVYYTDDAWTDEVNQIIEAHFIRLKNDFETGKVIHVGRTENPKDDGFGLVIYHADHDHEAKTYMENDPAIIHGIMTGTYQKYKVVFNLG